jgi:hypothetical protein
VFPDVVIPPPWDVSDIQTQAYAAFQKWGDEAQLKVLYPNMPPMTPPRPVNIVPPVHIETETEIQSDQSDEINSRIKGRDLSKEQLEELN